MTLCALHPPTEYSGTTCGPVLRQVRHPWRTSCWLLKGTIDFQKPPPTATLHKGGCKSHPTEQRRNNIAFNLFPMEKEAAVAVVPASIYPTGRAERTSAIGKALKILTWTAASPSSGGLTTSLWMRPYARLRSHKMLPGLVGAGTQEAFPPGGRVEI